MTPKTPADIAAIMENQNVAIRTSTRIIETGEGDYSSLRHGDQTQRSRAASRTPTPSLDLGYSQFGRTGTAGYEVRKVDDAVKASQISRGTQWGLTDPRMAQIYLPVWFVWRGGNVYLAGSEKAGGFFSPNDSRARELPEDLLQTLRNAGVPESLLSRAAPCCDDAIDDPGDFVEQDEFDR